MEYRALTIGLTDELFLEYMLEYKENKYQNKEK